MKNQITGRGRLAAAAILALLASGCATTNGTHPDDMSYQEHKSHSEAEESRARRAEETAEEYENFPGAASYPGHSHFKSRSDLHRRRAAAHAAAADELRRFHADACMGVDDQSALCPFEDHHGLISAIRRRADGMEVVYPKGFPMTRGAIEGLSRCHYAEGRLLGHKDMPGCPLFLKGLHISSADNKDGSFSLFVTTEEPESLKAIHAWAETKGGETVE
jgi:hypothetical protein